MLNSKWPFSGKDYLALPCFFPEHHLDFVKTSWFYSFLVPSEDRQSGPPPGKWQNPDKNKPRSKKLWGPQKSRVQFNCDSSICWRPLTVPRLHSSSSWWRPLLVRNALRCLSPPQQLFYSVESLWLSPPTSLPAAFFSSNLMSKKDKERILSSSFHNYDNIKLSCSLSIQSLNLEFVQFVNNYHTYFRSQRGVYATSTFSLGHGNIFMDSSKFYPYKKYKKNIGIIK